MTTARYDKLLEPISDISIACESLLMGVFGPMGGDQREGVKTIYASAGGLYALVMDIITSLGLENVARRSYVYNRFMDVLNPIVKNSRALLDEMDGPLTEEQEVTLIFVNEIGMTLHQHIETLWQYSQAAHRRGVLDRMLTTPQQLVGRLHVPDGLPIQLETTIAPDVPAFSVDVTRMAAALNALIDNAARHSGSDIVTLQIRRDGQRLAFVVSDQGNGIPARHMQNVLKPFFQVDELEEGLGLGLPLAQAIADWHGGQLQLVSDRGLNASLLVPLV